MASPDGKNNRRYGVGFHFHEISLALECSSSKNLYTDDPKQSEGQ